MKTASFKPFVLIPILLALIAGCESDYDNDDYDDRDDQRLPDDDRGSSGVRLPSDARQVASGDEIIRYRAPENGQVYLYDAAGRVVIDARYIPRGREYIVSTKDDRAWIDDDRVLEYDFPRDRQYRIYFLPESGRDNDDRDDDDRDNTDNGRNDDNTGPFPTTPTTGVPKSATIAREGRGDLSFEADGAGTVYVYDVQNRKVLATHRLKKGQRFTVSPANGNAAVDGKQVFKKTMNPKLSYRLYFNLDI